LPKNLKEIVFEVDVAAQESRAFNPMTETADILLFDPLEDRYQQSRVLDLFKRLPARMRAASYAEISSISSRTNSGS